MHVVASLDAGVVKLLKIDVFQVKMTILSCIMNCEGQCLKWTF